MNTVALYLGQKAKNGGDGVFPSPIQLLLHYC